jgi:probable F420-dependent oxidoreductase
MGVESIRFGLQAGLDADPRAFLDLARKAEDAGFDTFYVADHPGETASPFAALAAAAGVTSTLKLGTYVLNVGIRDPLSIASDAATVDLISNGRVVLGLGAGHTPAEWAMTGRDYPAPAVRVGRLEETVDVVTRLLAGEVVTHHGARIHVDDAYLLTPRPVQEKIPLLIGGNGERVVRLGGRVADIVSLTGTGPTLADGHRHQVDWTDAAITERVSIVRAAAPASVDSESAKPVLDALVQHLAITRDRVAAAEQVVPHVPGASAADVLGSPYVLLGTLDELATEIAQHYERWGFTSYVVRPSVFDAAVALIDRLRDA